MKKINVNEIAAESKFKPQRIIQKDEVEVVILAFKPGQGLPIHKTPVDVFFYIMEGEVEVTIGEEVKSISAGSIILSPADIPHTVKNKSNADNKIMVVKTPNPNK